MMKRLFSIVIVLSGMLSAMMAQQFKIDGEFRSRAVINHGYKVPVKKDVDPVFSVDQRTRLSLSFMQGPISTRFTLQDARLWGSDDEYNSTGIAGNSGAFGIHEAWVQIALSEHSRLRVGRQEWNYDDMRILSRRNWWTSGLSYDGLLYKYSGKDNRLALDLGLSYNNNGNSAGAVDNSDWPAEKIKTLNFLHTQLNPGERTSIALMATHSGMIDTSSNTLVSKGTYGLVSSYNRGTAMTDGLFGSVSAYYQNGRDVKKGSDGESMKVSTYLLSADIGLRTFEKKLEVYAGFELISGRDYRNTGAEYLNTRHSFDMLYGARFPYYGGNMNHFIMQDSYKTGTKGGAYFDPYVRVKSTLRKKSIVEIGFYMPQLASHVSAHEQINPITKKPSVTETDAQGNTVYWKGSLGQYIDLKYTHKFSKELILKAGISYGNISDIKNQMVFGYKDAESKVLHDAGMNYFSWVALIVKPTLLAR